MNAVAAVPLPDGRVSVGHLESGRRGVRAADLPALCRILGVDLPKLLDGADPEDRRALGV